MKIGHLNEFEERGYRQLYGEIQTLEIDLKFRLVSRPEQGSENSPDYAIVAKSKAGRDVNIGSAWRKTIKAGPRFGEEFLTLTVDDPSFPGSLNVAAFKDRAGGWDVNWRRRQDRQPTDADNG